MKQMDTTIKKIGDNTFYIKPFPAFTAAYITGLLSKTLGPLIGGLGGLVKGGSSGTDIDIMDIDMEEAFPAIGAALASVDPEQMELLVRKLLTDYKNVSIKGEITDNEVVLMDYDITNEVFCGELLDMLKLCWEVCRINFKGFFKNTSIQSGDLQGYMEKALKKLTNGESSTLASSAS